MLNKFKWKVLGSAERRKEGKEGKKIGKKEESKREKERSREGGRKERIQGLEENNSIIFCKQCVIFYAENSGDSADQNLETKSKFRMFAEHKINTKKSITFLHTNHKQLENAIF